MMKRLIGLCALTMGLAMFVACEDDPNPIVPPPPPPAPIFENLTQKWHVLNNVEVSYVKRRIDKYDELLDNNFTFYLYPADVGGTVPPQWNRDVEITANTNLFDPNYTGMYRAKSIEMDIVLPQDKSTMSWVEVDPASAPGETWYVTTVFYSFRLDTEPDTQYESPSGAKAQFTVRNIGTDDAPQWRLVEMRDLGGETPVASAARSPGSTSWGKVKALYR